MTAYRSRVGGGVGAAGGRPVPYRSVFTNMVVRTKNGSEPDDDLTEVPLDYGTVRLFVKWRGLSPGRTYRWSIEIFDGNRALVESTGREFRPKSSRWNTWLPFSVTPQSGTPGQWQAKVYLDHEVLLEKSLKIHEVEVPRVLLATPERISIEKGRYGSLKAMREIATRHCQKYGKNIFLVKPGPDSHEYRFE